MTASSSWAAGRTVAGRFRAFRGFLQSLKPGEIGFCIFTAGAISASLLLSNKVRDAKRDHEDFIRSQWRQMVSHVDRLVSEGTPLENLSLLKFYRKGLREKAVHELKLTDVTNDELCDEWVRRRNLGERSALEVEYARLRLKRFWHSIETCCDYHLERTGAAVARPGTDSVEQENDGSTRTTTTRNNSNEKPQPSILHELLSGGSDKHEPNDRLILKTLFFLESLDRACCRAHPKCIWERDQPSFYKFLRREADIDRVLGQQWPGPYSNDDDFDRDAPETNSAAYLGQYCGEPETRLSRGFRGIDRGTRKSEGNCREGMRQVP